MEYSVASEAPVAALLTGDFVERLRVGLRELRVLRSSLGWGRSGAEQYVGYGFARFGKGY